ncbi:unnamed protein product, partial [marine sediment metagenome]
NNNNATRFYIDTGVERLVFAHYAPDSTISWVTANCSLVAGVLCRWLCVRDDGGGTEPQHLAVYEWRAGAWVKTSSNLNGVFTPHNAVPAELRIGNRANENAGGWGAYELVAIKDTYDPTWDPDDGQAVTDSTWAAVYRQSGILDASKTSGGDSVVATVTGFVAINLATDAMWQNRDDSANRLILTIQKALGVNSGAVCADIIPLVLPAASRGVEYEIGTAGNNNRRQSAFAATAKLEAVLWDSAAGRYSR